MSRPTREIIGYTLAVGSLVGGAHLGVEAAQDYGAAHDIEQGLDEHIAASNTYLDMAEELALRAQGSMPENPKSADQLSALSYAAYQNSYDALERYKTGVEADESKSRNNEGTLNLAGTIGLLCVTKAGLSLASSGRRARIRPQLRTEADTNPPE